MLASDQREVRMAQKQKGQKWPVEAGANSDALDSHPKLFEMDDPAEIAAYLKRFAEHSKRRKANPFRSAMSMLSFYVNRAGRNLPASRKRVFEKAKDESRRDFHR
jgi:hypothetical protein